MNTLELKTILISEIEKIDDDQFLSALKTILDSRKIPVNYSEKYNEDLKVAEEDIQSGNFYSHNEIKDQIEQWKKEIIWSKAAQNQLEKIYFHIFKESKSKNISNKVIETIYNSVTILKTNWEIYELDEMKIPNNVNYRAYEIYSYRISYKITLKEIHILRIRHTSRNPKKL